MKELKELVCEKLDIEQEHEVVKSKFFYNGIVGIRMAIEFKHSTEEVERRYMDVVERIMEILDTLDEP